MERFLQNPPTWRIRTTVTFLGVFHTHRWLLRRLGCNLDANRQSEAVFLCTSFSRLPACSLADKYFNHWTFVSLIIDQIYLLQMSHSFRCNSFICSTEHVEEIPRSSCTIKLTCCKETSGLQMEIRSKLQLNWSLSSSNKQIKNVSPVKELSAVKQEVILTFNITKMKKVNYPQTAHRS